MIYYLSALWKSLKLDKLFSKIDTSNKQAEPQKKLPIRRWLPVFQRAKMLGDFSATTKHGTFTGDHNRFHLTNGAGRGFEPIR